MDNETEALRRAVEQPRNVTFWGRTHRIVPAFIDEIFGDGRQLAYVEPLNARPHHYVVRVDSSWSPENGGLRPTLGGMAGEILNAARDRWGDAWPDDEPDRKNGRPWPAVPSDDGCSYGFLEWPQGFKPAPDAADALIAVLAEAPILAHHEPFVWRRIAKSVLESLEVHLDPYAEVARVAACHAALDARDAWRWREANDDDGGLSEHLFGPRMSKAIAAALAAQTRPRTMRLTGLSGTAVVSRRDPEMSVYDAPDGLRCSELIAIEALSSGRAPEYRLLLRSNEGLTPVRIVDEDLRIDTTLQPWRLAPQALAAVREIRVRSDGVIASIPCSGLSYRDGDMPEDETLLPFLAEMRGEVPAAHRASPAPSPAG